MAQQAYLIHNLRNDTWYIVDGNFKVVTPICSSKNQLRIALAMICLALQGDVTEVDE